MRTPWTASGWTNATWSPKSPSCGVRSISCAPDSSSSPERDLHVGDLVGDVVHSGAALREEAADGGVVAERRDELDPPGADEHRRRLDALIRNRGAMLEAAAEELEVRAEGLVEIVHRDAEMVDTAGLHPVDPSCSYGSTLTVPMVSEARDSGSSSCSSSRSSWRSSVSFSSSAEASRSRVRRCLESSRCASS